MQIYEGGNYAEHLVESAPEGTLLEEWEKSKNFDAMPMLFFGEPKIWMDKTLYDSLTQLYSPGCTKLTDLQALEFNVQEIKEVCVALSAVSDLLSDDWSTQVVLSIKRENHWADGQKKFGSCKVLAEEQKGELKFAAQIKLLPRAEKRNWAMGNASLGMFLGTSIHEIGHVVWFCLDKNQQERWNRHCEKFKELPSLSRYADKSYVKTGKWEEAFCESLVTLLLSPRLDTYRGGRVEELKCILSELNKNGLRKK